MFSIPRFQANGGSGGGGSGVVVPSPSSSKKPSRDPTRTTASSASSSLPAAPSASTAGGIAQPGDARTDEQQQQRLAALNARLEAKRAKRAARHRPPASPDEPAPSPSATAADVVAPRPQPPAPTPSIHPSRLAASSALRHSLAVSEARRNRAVVAGAGGVGGSHKTKAKQRYLRAKKERRKGRLRARGSHGEGECGRGSEGAAGVAASVEGDVGGGSPDGGGAGDTLEGARRDDGGGGGLAAPIQPSTPARNGVTEARRRRGSADAAAGGGGEDGEAGSTRAKKRKRERGDDAGEAEPEGASRGQAEGVGRRAARGRHKEEPDGEQGGGQEEEKREQEEDSSGAPGVESVQASDLQAGRSDDDDEDDHDDDDEDDHNDDEDEGDKAVAAANAVAAPRRDSETPPALSRLPAPRRLNASDPRLLARQGLPAGLARPTLVDPELRGRLDLAGGGDGDGGGGGGGGAREAVEGDALPGEVVGASASAAETATAAGRGKASLAVVSEAMRARLRALGIEQWFAVQTVVVPLLLSSPQARSLYPWPPLRDVCVSAPTGSGKTLAYCVPIVEVLRRAHHSAPPPPSSNPPPSSSSPARLLRALVVLPTRDLVSQVRETLESVAAGTGVRVGVATGQSSFAHEQASLVHHAAAASRQAGVFEERGVEYEALDLGRGGGGGRDDWGLAPSLPAPSSSSSSSACSSSNLASSKVDVLLATPGRLLDHLEATPGFTLQHLRFLVLDEADRLLGQSFQDWLARVSEALEPSSSAWRRGAAPARGERGAGLRGSGARRATSASSDESAEEEGEDDEGRGDALRGAMAPAWLRARWDSLRRGGGGGGVEMTRAVGFGGEAAAAVRGSTVQKLLFSATLASDPAKLGALALRRPHFVSVQHARRGDVGVGLGPAGEGGGRFSLPATLREHMLVVPTEEKPLWLLWLLHGGGGGGGDDGEDDGADDDDGGRADGGQDGAAPAARRGLCFVKSTESAMRLVKLVELFERERVRRGLPPPPPSSSSRVSSTKGEGADAGGRVRVEAYSSELTAGARAKVLDEFKRGEIHFLVCSDLISRGMDLPSVRHVVCYDAPVDAAKYVHRVGRTARAGRRGDAWSLVERHEARFFRRNVVQEGARGAGGVARRAKVRQLRLPTAPGRAAGTTWAEFEAWKECYEVALEQLAAHFSRSAAAAAAAAAGASGLTPSL